MADDDIQRREAAKDRFNRMSGEAKSRLVISVDHLLVAIRLPPGQSMSIRARIVDGSSGGGGDPPREQEISIEMRREGASLIMLPPKIV